MTITYSFNSKEFVATYGVKVLSGQGLFDIPDRKDIQEYKFPDSNGYTPELSTVVYEERKITLKCIITASTPAGLIDNYYKFCYDLKNQTETKTLEVVFTPTTGTAKTLNFTAYCKSITQLEKQKFKDGENIASFTVTFIEPEPSITSY